MKEIEQLYFNTEIGAKKPENIINYTNKCPFCDIDALEDIFESDGKILWLKNKYPTLENADQTLIIETDRCDEDITTYEKDHMRKLIRFSIQKWKEMIDTKKYKSVILFKNHGPLSGGSIKHAHMQIVGLQDIEYKNRLLEDNFTGITVMRKNDVDVTISEHPIIGFTEINIALENENSIDFFADAIQVGVQYVLTEFHKGCHSYNLFFYEMNGKIICKIVPRFVVSPFFVGYKIPQVPIESRLLDIKEKLSRRMDQLF